MPIQTDILVIGSGAAGATAAARAEERGLSVYRISTSSSATAYSSGAIDLPTITEEQKQYFSEAFELFRNLTRPVNLNMLKDGALQSIPTQIGIVKRCFMVQASQAFDLKTLQPNDLLGIVEFSGLPNFKGSSVANMLNCQGYQAVPVLVDLKPLDGSSWKTFSRFAEDFEDEKFKQRCLEAIEAGVRQQGVAFKHLFFPAIFGLAESSEGFLKSIQLKTQVSASELLGLAHSIPGLRLANTLEKGSHRDMVTAFKCQDQKIVELTLGTGEIIFPKTVVLAAGRFLSGGFSSSPNFRESIFGLPLACVERSQIKLSVDAEQRPLDASGKLFATNLFAAGANLSGYVPTEEDGLGRAILSGYRVAEIIINKCI